MRAPQRVAEKESAPTMGAMVPPLHWPPEDDALLKSAVEAGASLESLAKGAVQFSRRYTVEELHDRWWSLLYDPVTVMEASPHIFEVERLGLMNQSRPAKPEIAKDTPFGSAKRKSESIRKCYYTMRKRICNDPLGIMSIDLLHESNSSNNNFGTQGLGIDVGAHSNPEFMSHAAQEGLQFDPDLDTMHNNLSLDGDLNGIAGFDQSEELPLSNLFEPNGLPNQGNEFGPGPYRNLACSSSTMPQMPMWDTSPDVLVPIQTGEKGQHAQDTFIIPEPSNNANEADNYLAEISNTLFDDLLFVDNNGNEAIDNSYYDGFSSLLLDSQSQAEVVADGEDLPQVETSTTSNNKILGPEYTNDVICCTLNTEDPEIPSNEDVFLPFRFASPSNSPRCPDWRSEGANYLVSTPLVKDSPSGCKLPPVAKNKQKDTCVMGTSQPLDKGSRKPVKDQGVKFELPKSNPNHAALRNARIGGVGNRNRINSANVTANCYIGGGVVRRCDSVEMMDRGKNVNCEPVGVCVDNKREGGLEVLESLNNNNTNNNNDDDTTTTTTNNNNYNNDDAVKEEILNGGSLPDGDMSSQKAIDKAQLSDMEEWSENDVPCFSDVEAMILDMDLSPDEFCLYSIPEVQKYLREECVRAIIRLEQTADACTQRDVASHSAFAVLYGRFSKHFIKKPEVVLGRSTEDNIVDIDLGRHKNGGKISRRQATIKMDMHGIFQLTNLGKYSIYVNGDAVLPRQSLSLGSDYLIEVRGLTFIFAINRTLVDQFVNSIGEGNLTVES